MALFIQKKKFSVNELFDVTTQMKMLIPPHGDANFRSGDYHNGFMDRTSIYPDIVYSIQNEAHHKAEFNPKFKTLEFYGNSFIKGVEFHDDIVRQFES